jgi:hypothetical protein
MTMTAGDTWISQRCLEALPMALYSNFKFAAFTTAT